MRLNQGNMSCFKVVSFLVLKHVSPKVKIRNNIIRQILGLRLGSIETSVHQPEPRPQSALMGHISRLMKRPTDEWGFIISGQHEGLNAEQNYCISRQ